MQDASDDEGSEEDREEDSASPSPSPSPLQYRAMKGLSKAQKKSLQGGPPCIGLREEEMAIDEVDADETMTHGSDEDEEDEEEDEEKSVTDASSDSVEVEDEEDEDEEYIEDVSDGENWTQSRGGTPSTTASLKEANTPKPIGKSKTNALPMKTAPIVKKGKEPSRGMSDLHRRMNTLTIGDSDDEVEEVSVPIKKRQSKR